MNSPSLLVREVLHLNQPEASDGWLTQDALWLVSKTVCDRLRAHLLSQGIGGVPDRNTAVFDVLQEHGIAQPTPDGKAIWRATVTSNTGWTQPFTFLRLSPALIWDTGDRPPPFNGAVRLDPGPETVSGTDPGHETTSAPPAAVPQPPPLIDNPPPDAPDSADSLGGILRLLDESSPGIAPPAAKPASSVSKASQLSHPSDERLNTIGNIVDSDVPTGDPRGERFLQWLRDGIQSHHLIINDAKALVHTVGGTAFLVSPGLFQRYLREHPEAAPPNGIQRRGKLAVGAEAIRADGSPQEAAGR